MTKNSRTKKPLALAIGGAFAATLAASPIANAADNPFGMTQLSGGYMQVAQAEGKCGEGKCGGSKAAKSSSEGTCGGSKQSEGKPMAEGKGGGAEPAAKPVAEGKCGEGKCGGNK
jgi:uncharacterized low-complexity protein